MKRYLFLSILCALGSSTAASATTYAQNFNAFADGIADFGDGTTLYDWDEGAGVFDFTLRLTKLGTTGARASWQIPGLLGASQGWVATFDFKFISGSALPADGFSFSWGSGLFALDGEGMVWPFSEDNTEERGMGTAVDHLFFGFDTFNNGGGDHGLRIGAGGNGEQVFTNHPGALLGVDEVRSGSVRLAWHPTQGASFRTTGFANDIDVTNVPTQDFTAADSNSFAFAARTGALTQGFYIDNVVITTVPEPGTSGIVSLALLCLLRRARRRPAH